MRRGSYLLAFGCSLLFTFTPAAAQEPPPAPKVLLLVREEIKTGKMGAHSVEANNTVQIWSKAKSPHHRLAMVPVAGNENEVLYLWPFDSYASLESYGRDLDKISVTHKADFDRIALQNNGEDLHTSQRDAIAVLREDLSYRPNIDIAKMRYFRMETIRIKPGSARNWEEGRRILKAAHEKAKIDENLVVYQIAGGMQNGTYLVFIPWKSLADMGTLPHGKEYWDGMGEGNREKMDKFNGDSVLFNDLAIYAFDPQLSYLPAQLVAADPFWKFKPMSAQPATTVAARKPVRR